VAVVYHVLLLAEIVQLDYELAVDVVIALVY